MQKIFYSLFLIPIIVGCQGFNPPSYNRDTHFVDVTLDFNNQLPSDFQYICILIKDARLASGLVTEDFKTWVYPEDFVNGCAKFSLNAKPIYYEMPYVSGKYYLHFLARSYGYESYLPELDLNEIDKYSELEYRLIRFENSGNPGTAYFELVSSKQR